MCFYAVGEEVSFSLDDFPRLLTHDILYDAIVHFPQRVHSGHDGLV